MLLIGLLLVLAAAAAGGIVVYDGAETSKVEFFGHHATMSVSGIFFAGVATMIVFLLGLWMMQGSLGRARRRRLARREARVEHRDSVRSLEEEKAQLAMENARLERQLQRDRAAAGTSGAAVGGTTAAATSAAPARDADGDGVPDRAERGGLFSRNRDRDGNGVADREDALGGNHRSEPPAR
jgi:ABC-type nickel/cobalt efflux system permease component RcnA